jgi:hypothetical protein
MPDPQKSRILIFDKRRRRSIPNPKADQAGSTNISHPRTLAIAHRLTTASAPTRFLCAPARTSPARYPRIILPDSSYARMCTNAEGGNGVAIFPAADSGNGLVSSSKR